MSDTESVDCRGLDCPQPVITTKERLSVATSPFVVIVDNEGSCTNVRRFAESWGARVVVERLGADFRLTVEPGHGVVAEEEPAIVCETAGERGTVVYVACETMGRGDEKLGAILMASFLDTLSHFKGEISHVILVNGGAKLAAEGSPVLKEVRHLEELGTKVLVCGTCLDSFGIKDRLAVGSVSNMYAIIETLNRAGRIIRP